MTIRVLIADDHKVVAEALRHLIEARGDMEVLDTVPSGREAVRRAVELQPDVVLMDSSMPNLNGIEATRILLERCPGARVVMLSVHSDAFHIVRALRAGASGYVPKSSAGIDVVEAIRAVCGGNRYLHPTIAASVLEQLVESKVVEDPLARLSSRERQVLQLISEGRSVSEMALALSLSPRTVETYRSRMMEKLDIRDVPGLVKFAILHGIASLE
ncbi:MAG: response regulator transcription factor [Usitatibacter sp.]